MNRETRDFHTRLLRLALACDESRTYWRHARGGIPALERSQAAFEERWFGTRSMPRVRYLLLNFGYRFDAFPAALDVLARWGVPDPVSRRNICHWHAQLTDPVYRDFTGRFLVERRGRPDRDVVARWVDARLEGRWSFATTRRMATALLTCATEAGLCDVVPPPQVTDEALAYLFYLLREVDIEGTLTRNPYLESVGLRDGLLEQRLRRLPGLRYHRMDALQDFGWQHPDLLAWGAAR